METIAQRIADFTSSLTYEALPSDVHEKVKVALLHNLGVALANGAGTEISYRYAEVVDASGSARVFRTGRMTTPEIAAFVNATLIHARAQDDVYFPGLTHVGATLIPAVLAIGEQRGSSGPELITALAAGYEAAGALSEQIAPRTTARGFRATGLYGVLGAAIGVARLLGLDGEATTNALSIASGTAAGTNQTWVAGSQEWQFHVGFAARNGITAALLADAGGVGAPDALEGEQGFYSAFLGDRAGVDGTVGRDLGAAWRIREVTYKPFPVCAILQAPVSDAVALRAERRFEVDQITAARLTLSPVEAAYPGTDSTGPFRSVGATLMSAQFCLAVALQRGTVTAADLQRTNDPDLLALAHRVEVCDDAELSPRSFRLEIDLVGGEQVVHTSAGADTFNWDRHGVQAQLRSMEDELPTASTAEQLATVALQLEKYPARDLVSACVLQDV